MDYKEKVIALLNSQELTKEQKEKLENIFPELKENESEDERIKKAIIRILKGEIGYTSKEDIDKYVTWLEKQEEPKDKGEISDGYHTFNELYRYRLLYNAAFFNLLPKELVHKSKKHHDGEECFGGGWFIVMANLPTGQISNHYELKDWDLFKIPEKEVADMWDGHTPQDAADRLHKYLLEKQGENKHTGEVESKFHEGEWIIHQGTENIYQVVACIDNQYQLKYGDNYTVQKCTDVDRCARLWTIADAKDGDVLVCEGLEYLLFKSFSNSDGRIKLYCWYNKPTNNFHGSTDSKLRQEANIQPATKEQRDLLFQKMKGAGYEWDSEKNEPKKVEQGNHPRIVMADFTGGEGFYKLNLDNLNKEQVTAIEIMINNPKPGKKLDADKVIEWLKPYSVIVDNIIDEFKKDFGL